MKEKKIQTKKKDGEIRFPANVLAPVGQFLRLRLTNLKKRKQDIEKEDPFKDTDRIIDNASPDTDAAEQFGHARTSALRQQIEKK